MSQSNIELNKVSSKAYKYTLKDRLVDLGKQMWTYKLSYVFVAPFLICFLIFVVTPVAMAAYYAFTYYNVIEPPKFIGWENFRLLLTEDEIFVKYAIPNTFKYAVIVGPLGYALQFFLAYIIGLVPGKLRNFFTLAIYLPSLAGGIMMSTVWKVLFSGDRRGYLNSLLINLGVIEKPILWVTSADYLMSVMIFVTLWSSMGIGFLAIRAAMNSVNVELYEAGAIDGIKNKLQEVWYITIPSIKPQMLFAAVMATIGTLKSGGLGSVLSGMNPTPKYSAHLILNHMSDYGFTRYELGYASAISLVLTFIIFGITRVCFALFKSEDGE